MTLAKRTADAPSGPVALRSFGPVNFGSVGGTYRTENTATLNAALASGLAVQLPDGIIEISGQLNASTANTRLFGSRNCVIKDARGPGIYFTFQIAADGVELNGFTIDGGGASGTSYTNGHRAIYCNQTVYTPSHVINYTLNLRLIGLRIKNYEADGIRMDYVQRCEIRNNRIEFCAYHGIMLGAGCFDNTIDGNHVSDIVPGDGGGTPPYHPAYGITITRDPARSTTDAPISMRNVISNNRVERVNGWNGIDSHGSQYTQIINNYVKHCAIGIHMEDGDASGVGAYVPSNYITIEGNYIISNQGTGFGVGPGINLQGAATNGDPQLSISVVGNTLVNCGTTAGLYTAGSHGAIHCYIVRGLTVTGNLLENSQGVGVWLDEVSGAVVTGNVMRGLTSSGGLQAGIYLADGDCTVAIDINQFDAASPALGITAASAVDGGFEYKVGTNNIKYGTMTLIGSNLPTPA